MPSSTKATLVAMVSRPKTWAAGQGEIAKGREGSVPVTLRS